MGKKYIIELESEPFKQYVGIDEPLYRVKGFNSLVFDMTGIGKLTPYTEPDLEQVRKEAYQKGYETGYEDGYNEPGKNQQEAYQRGLNDAWEAVRRIEFSVGNGGLLTDTIAEIFGTPIPNRVLRDFTASEAIEKIRQYEQDKEEIKVGDEVENTQTGVKFIVTHLWKNNLGEQGVSGFNQECSAFSTTLDLVVKTGHAFPEIAAIFEKMRNESNAQIDT